MNQQATGNFIALKRREKNLTQEQLADKLGISQSYISRLEKRILDKMRKIIEERIRVA